MTKPGVELQGTSGNDEIGTPDDLFARLNRAYCFDYDAAASRENHLLPFYSTKDGTFVQDETYGVSDQYSGLDGLNCPWEDRRVFVNPPYSGALFDRFIEKAIAERNNAEIIVMLIKIDTSTARFRRLQQYADIHFLKRVRYKGMTQGATFASGIAILRQDWQ